MRHFFCDSLKRFLMALVATLAFVAPTFADEAIQSVTVVGATEQSGTPTPSAPANIKTNNGVIKVSRNLYNATTRINSYYIKSSGELSTVGASSWCTSDFIPVKAGAYVWSFNNVLRDQFKRLVYYPDKSMTNYTVLEAFNGMNVTGFQTFNITVPADGYVRFALGQTDTNVQLEQGSIATPYHPYGEVYVDGTTETIADSANHTATVATLLGIGDNYKDEQNINTGAITRNVGVKVLDGTEGYTWNTTTNSFYSTQDIRTILPSSVQNNQNTINCTHLMGTASVPATADRAGKIFMGTMGGVYRLFVGFTSVATTSAEVNDYLAEQYANGTPVIIVYPLATETTESVTAQTMTTAPVRQVSGSLRTTIRTILTSGQELVSGGISIATTKYTEDAFAGLMTTLSEAITKVTNIVDTTVQQATEIGNLATTKQDRPDTDCPAGRKCLLIMGADNKPHWYLIQE